MRYVRFLYGSEPTYGLVQGSEVKIISGDIFGIHSVTDMVVDFDEIKLLPPVDPPNIVAIGINYRDHAEENNVPIPASPVVFLKATNSALACGEPIVLPGEAPFKVDYEAELAIIIRSDAKNVSRDKAKDYIFGYTCGNDVTARDCQMEIDMQWARAKSFDTFCPLGPEIVTDVNPAALDISCRLNGEMMQHSNTSNLIFDPYELVSYLSNNMTLYAKTVIMSGTPGGIGYFREPQVFLREGDVVEVEVEEIGVLRNPVGKGE